MVLPVAVAQVVGLGLLGVLHAVESDAVPGTGSFYRSSTDLADGRYGSNASLSEKNNSSRGSRFSLFSRSSKSSKSGSTSDLSAPEKKGGLRGLFSRSKKRSDPDSDGTASLSGSTTSINGTSRTCIEKMSKDEYTKTKREVARLIKIANALEDEIAVENEALASLQAINADLTARKDELVAQNLTLKNKNIILERDIKRLSPAQDAAGEGAAGDAEVNGAAHGASHVQAKVKAPAARPVSSAHLFRPLRTRR